MEITQVQTVDKNVFLRVKVDDLDDNIKYPIDLY